MSEIPSFSRGIPWILFTIFLSSLSFQGNSQPENREQSVLLKLKQQWNNPSPIASWDPRINGSYCNWIGVVCSDAGHVTGLNFRNFNITDKIPPSICDLENLTEIDLSYNYIPGEFPTILYNCSKLQSLDLSQNYFVGAIPVDIDRISTLTVLDLGANNFSGEIPAAIGRFPSLQRLGLYRNLFNGSMPREIGNLSNLQVLQLAYNKFAPSRIPSEFGKLKKLSYLWMASTNLIGDIPMEFRDLENLEHLDISFNDLSGNVSDNLFLLKNLTYLYLYGNRLSGEIPRNIESLYLEEIDLSMNELTGSIPEDIGKLQYLKYLYIYANRLTGEIPASMGLLPSLKGIRLFKNKLTGNLPRELGRYSKLEELQVSENQLTGNLPPNLCAGNAFYGLVAFSNNLTGELPRSLGNCNSLESVQLYKNRFYGEVPAGLWSATNVSLIMISFNSFSGELPDILAWNLSRLEISNNRFSGKIPSGIKASKNLNVFTASNNNFSGEIPSELTSLSQLSVLNLAGNRLRGQLPNEIISWSSLTSLNLSRNQLSGVIPPAIGSLPDLNALDLSENQFSGEIPPEISRLRLSFLNFSSNMLTGRIPVQFDNLGYDRSFLNNPGLCSANTLLYLGACNAEVPSKASKEFPAGILALIIILSGVVILATVLIVIKFYSTTKHRKDAESWKLTSFQRLDFTESSILSSLTENNLIGSGASGKVYRVYLSRSGSYVAVKKIWSKKMLEKEFEAEVKILGTIRHFNVLKLLCCISNQSSNFLVYEYMENGSLDRWLHGRKTLSSPSSSVHHVVLDWPRRLHIATGAAQGLCYMHHGCSPPIIHRDVKSSNILLDSEFRAKVADFGLAKMMASQGEHDPISVIAGSFGYIAPEYAHSTKVNEKSDVYSFGVVLLELATGREANEGGEKGCLAEWAWWHFQEGFSIENAVDEEVKESCYLNEMCTVFKLGLMCTATLPSTRPTMKEVLQVLLRYCTYPNHREKKTQLEYDVAPLLNPYQSQHRITTSTSPDDDGGSLASDV